MIIPVFDVKEGKCVSGMSGKRDSYTPLQSVYGNDLCEILENLKISGAHAVYVADLDKIESKGDNSELIEKINELLPVLLDNGANNIDDIIHNRNICRYIILATETMTSLEEIRNIFKENPTERIIISIDIKNNELLIKNKDIKLEDVIDLVNKVQPDYTILLNISEVGTKKGNDNTFIKNIISRTPHTQHIIAGGITNQSIKDYKIIGIDNFLIGTILHDGTMLEEYKW
jgi:phosphoribosylformimino-5-aminoimidazole carboxamide ribotide isomerase